MDRPVNVTRLSVTHSRSRTGRTTVDSDEEFGRFMGEVAQAASTARSVAVTVDVWALGPDGVQPDVVLSKGKKRARAEDIPPREFTKDEEESADIFNRIKDRLVCERHSKGSNDIYCVIDRNRGKEDKHMQVSLMFIGQWVHACMEGKADEFNPPSCRRLDKMARTRTYISDSEDDESVIQSISGTTGFNFEAEEDELEFDYDLNSLVRNTQHSLLSTDNSLTKLPELIANTSSSSTVPPPMYSLGSTAPHTSSSLFSVMPNAVPNHILLIYMSIPEALDALHAAKPNHQFPELSEAFQSAGYHYIDEILSLAPKELAEEVDGLTIPAARVLLAFAQAQIQYQVAFD